MGESLAKPNKWIRTGIEDERTASLRHGMARRNVSHSHLETGTAIMATSNLSAGRQHRAQTIPHKRAGKPTIGSKVQYAIMAGAMVLALGATGVGSVLWYNAHRPSPIATVDNGGLLVMPAGNGFYTLIERDLKVGTQRKIGIFTPDQLHEMGIDLIGYQFKDQSIGARLMALKTQQDVIAKSGK